MKTSYKAALLAALGLATVSAVQAAPTSDMLLGLSDLAGTSSAQNDYVIDLGDQTLFTPTATLTFGANTANGINTTTLGTAFGADSSYLSDVDAGVVAAGLGGFTPRTLFATFITPPASGPARSIFNNAAALAQSPSIGEYTSASGLTGQSGWSYFVAPSDSLQITEGQVNNTVASDLNDNPLQQLSSGVITENLYESTQANSVVNGTAWTEIGTFNINLNSDTVTFNGVDVVPEPAPKALLVGAGLLLVVMRRQFIKKNI